MHQLYMRTSIGLDGTNYYSLSFHNKFWVLFYINYLPVAYF